MPIRKSQAILRCIWCQLSYYCKRRRLVTKFYSYKVPPVMVSTHGSVVPLAMFSFCLRSFDRNFGPNQRSILFQNCVWLPSIQDHLQVMRDHPNHGSKILGGLWGGSNYMNMSLAVQARLDSFETLSWNRFFPKDPFSRAALYSVPMSSRYGYDLDVLERRVWPLIRWEVTLCLRIGVLEDI